MARIRAILGALFTAFRRNRKSLGSFATNNFFLMSLYFLRQAGAFVYLIAGFVMLFPLSADPLRKVPPVRLALWPLDQRERLALRILSPWLNPVTWILAVLAAFVARGRVTAGLWLLMAALFAIGFLTPAVPLGRGLGAFLRIPHMPGPLNHLIRKNLREMLSTLDFYCGLMLSGAFLACRLAGMMLPPEARLAMTLLVVLSISSYAQCLFGLDSDQALTRYRLLPLRGWQVLAAKDAAFLLAAIVLSLPLDPLPGLAAALAALAVGHAASVRQRREQTRWRFSSGASVGAGLLQVLFLAGAAGTVFANALFILPVVAGYLGSTWWYGRVIERELLST